MPRLVLDEPIKKPRLVLDEPKRKPKLVLDRERMPPPSLRTDISLATIPRVRAFDPFDPSEAPSPTPIEDRDWGYAEAAYPILKGLEYAHIPIERAFKAGTGITGVGPIAGAISRIDPSELLRYPRSLAKGLKALVPWPGMAEDVPTLGETLAKDWYEPLMGKPAPGWYAPLVDISAEVAVLGAPAARRARGAQVTPKYGTARLTKAEIQAATKLYSRRAIARAKPEHVRAILAETARAERAAKAIQVTGIAAKGNIAAKTKSATARLVKSIKKAKRLRPQREAMIHKEKARRVAIAQKIRQDPRLSPTEAAIRSRGVLKGEYPSPVFGPIEILAEDKYLMLQSIRSSPMAHFQYRGTTDALMKVLSGELPTRGDIQLLEKHFGRSLARAILAKRPAGQKAWETIIDIANIPRATLASWDLSFPLRQGAILVPGHPRAWTKSFGQMLKSAVPFKGKQYARMYEQMAAQSKWAPLRSKSGLEITQWGLAGITGREEAFMSSYAELIPGVKWSERAFTTMSNQLRINVFDDVARHWQLAGVTWESNADAYVKLAKFLNHATGRGHLGRFQHIAPELNAAFFSPRYQISRPQVVYDAFASLGNAPARKVIAGDLVKFVSTGMGILGVLKMGGTDVEIDPRSSDFGKVRIGNTRYDFWAGNQQIARLTAQMITGEAKAVGTGKLIGIDRDETMLRFIRYKMSPPAGLAWDILKGETVMGEELTPESFNIKKEAWERTVPMFIQDVRDSIRYQGLDGTGPIISETALSIPEQVKQIAGELGRGIIERPGTAALAFTGVGVQTWQPSKWTEVSKEQERLALETFGKEWENLGPTQQKMIERTNPGLQQMRREATFEQTRATTAERFLKESFVAGRAVKKNLSPNIKTELNRLKIPIGNVPRTLGRFILNDERFDLYQKMITNEINNIAPILSSSSYKKLNDTQKVRFLEGRIEQARNRARKRIRIGSIREGFER